MEEREARKIDEKSRVPFTKIQGLGNEYLFIDRFAYKTEHDWSRLSRVIGGEALRGGV